MKRKLTPDDMAHENALAKRVGIQVPEGIDPASLLFP